MTIELNLTALRTQTRTALEDGVVSRMIQQELSRICEKHHKAAVEEMQSFVARVATVNDVGFATDCTVIKISIPDLKE